MTQHKQTVWDIPTRLFHWLIVLCVAFSWWSAENGELLWHTRSGYALLTLLLFRILWGFFGSSTARFSQFVRSPATVWRYGKSLFAKSATYSAAGHNPMGGWSVITLLTLLLTQITLGLFSEDIDGLDSGPLSYLVSYKTGRLAADFHEIVFDVLLVFIVLHIVTVFYYWLVKKDNLILPMITGKKDFSTVQAIQLKPLWLAAVLLAVAAGFVWWLVS